MHRFWTYVSAEFVVHTLSAILFSGRFPRLVAVVLSITVGSILISLWGIKTIFRFIGWIVLTQNIRARRALNRVAKIAETHGDQVMPIEEGPTGWRLTLENPQYRNGHSRVFISITKSGDQLQISGMYGGHVVDIPFGIIAQHVPQKTYFCMHRDFAEYVFFHLRLNYF